MSKFILNRKIWTTTDKIRFGVTSLYLFRTCSISAPNTSTLIFGPSSIYLTEFIFWLSNFGFGWLLYKSSHLAKFSFEKRLIYASFLSTTFNFGSIMIVANASHFFGRIEILRLISGLTLSGCLLSIGRAYLDDLNSETC